jgi:hypothetical protein
MRTLLLACALIAAVVGSSPAAAADKPIVVRVSASAPAKNPPPRGLSDATIEQTIRMKLAKSKIGKDGFKVRVQNGVAYWEGKTDVIQHKGAATRMAKTAGAVAVVNHIQISEAARRKAADRLRAKAGASGAPPKATVVRPGVSNAPK